jgi:nitrite reductase/ring-hydroxylating ferredoxin subunit
LRYFVFDRRCAESTYAFPAGDIEDGVCGHTCLVCPWHNYKISITTGEGFYQNLDRKWVSKGKVLQRVHDIEERDDGVYVRFNATEHEIASDKYACDASMPILGCSEIKQP